MAFDFRGNLGRAMPRTSEAVSNVEPKRSHLRKPSTQDLAILNHMTLDSAPAILRGVISEAQAGDFKARELYFKYALSPAREAVSQHPQRLPAGIAVAVQIVAPDAGKPQQSEKQKVSRQVNILKARAVLLRNQGKLDYIEPPAPQPVPRDHQLAEHLATRKQPRRPPGE